MLTYIFKYEIDSIVVRIEIYPMFLEDVNCSQLFHYALCSPLEVSLFILLAFDGPSSSCSSFTSNSCFTFSPPVLACCQASGVYHVLVGTISVTTCKYYQHKDKV